MSMYKLKGLLAQELSCPICLGLFSEPVSLPCGHNYCQSCIRAIIESKESKEGPYSCPECRQEYQGSKELQKNLKLCNIIDSYRATLGKGCYGEVLCDSCVDARKAAVKTCLTCEISLCYKHLQLHSAKASFCQHSLVEPLSDLNQQKCSNHGKALEYFCATDSSFLCSTCFIEGTHQNHDIQNMESAEAEMRQILELDLKLLREKIQMTESLLQTSQMDTQVLIAANDKWEGHCVAILGTMVNLVNGFHSRLRQHLEEEKERQQVNWRTNINQSLSQHSQLQDIQEETKSTLAETDKCLFAHRFLQLKPRLKQVIANKVLVATLKPADVKKVCSTAGAEDFKADMNQLLQDLHIFLNPLDLTFNPNTVHSNLLLSNDLKTVKYSPNKQVYKEQPERFVTAPQVLCSKGFSSGQHIWVVELGQGMWSLGACYVQMARRGDQSRLGHNIFSWRLQWKNKKLSACHASSTVPLPFTVPPTRVEVVLDFEGGTLSFYSSGEQRTHLHTFRATFRDTLFPAFSVHSTTSESWITLQS